MPRPNIYQGTTHLQAFEYLETFVQQAKRVLRPAQKSVCAQLALSKNAIDAYHSWKQWGWSSYSNSQEEFCLQTVFMHFLRVFFLRVCEDHGMTSHTVSSLFLENSEQTNSSLISHFFGRLNFYDWYTFDKKTISTLRNMLEGYDFRELNVDVPGKVYNEGYIEHKARSEKGQFYTPAHLVEYMLDTLGMPRADQLNSEKARDFLEKTVGDLSCGSGSFLVAAAARKRTILQRLVAAQQVTPEYALQIMTSTLLGFDLNPFACYLTEINLLMQCLPFLIDEQGQVCRDVKRFHIYCTDVLEPTIAEQVYVESNGKAQKCSELRSRQSGQQECSEEERYVAKIKDAKGLPAELTQFRTDLPGIDYLVGNPPYVSASEGSESLGYRDKVWNYGIYSLLHQRWDLFIPFFERNLQFLRPKTGRLGLIVSNGIETEGYAERLRRKLSKNYRLLQLDFFPELRLFPNAAVENSIVSVEHSTPDEEHVVIRRRHRHENCQCFETLPPLLQVSACERLFRWRYDAVLYKELMEGTLPLCAIAYIGTGIEAQSNEAFDPVLAGKRQKRFTLDDVFLYPDSTAVRPIEYLDDGVLGDDIDDYFLHCKRYVAYEKYCTLMRGRRHPALFRTPDKLLLGETSGGYYDRSGLFANHSVQVVVPWKALERAGVLEERGIRRVYHKSCQITCADSKIGVSNCSLTNVSALFDLRYLLGIINSRFMRQYMVANMHEGTRKNRMYPDVWKRLPIKVASPQKQRQIGMLVEEVQGLYERLALVRSEEQEIRMAIDKLLLRIESLVEEVYRGPTETSNGV